MEIDSGRKVVQQAVTVTVLARVDVHICVRMRAIIRELDESCSLSFVVVAQKYIALRDAIKLGQANDVDTHLQGFLNELAHVCKTYEEKGINMIALVSEMVQLTRALSKFSAMVKKKPANFLDTIVSSPKRFCEVISALFEQGHDDVVACVVEHMIDHHKKKMQNFPWTDLFCEACERADYKFAQICAKHMDKRQRVNWPKVVDAVSKRKCLTVSDAIRIVFATRDLWLQYSPASRPVVDWESVLEDCLRRVGADQARLKRNREGEIIV